MKGFGGSGKRRCRKGLSCGETCISRKKECVIDLPKPVAKSTTRFRDKVKDVIDKVKSGVSNIFDRGNKMSSGAPPPPGGAPPPPSSGPPPGGPTPPPPPPKGGPQPRAKERPEKRFDRAIKILETASGASSFGGNRGLDINYKGISEFKNRYTAEREKLLRAYRTAERLREKIEKSNISDSDKTKMLGDLDKVLKNTRQNLVDAIRLESESWSATIKQYKKDPNISPQDKKNLSQSLRANADNIRALREARSQGISDKEFQKYLKSVAEAAANNAPPPNPPKGIPGLADEVRRRTGAKPPPGAPPPVPPGDLPRRPGETGGTGRGGRGGGGGYGGRGGGRPYEKVEEGVASFVRKIVEAISKLLSKVTGIGGDDASLIEKNARRLANRLPKEQRDKLLKLLDKKFPKKVKIPDKGPKDSTDLAQSARKIMDKYDKSLRSASSLIRRSSTLLNELNARLDQTPASDVAARNRLIRSYDRAWDRYQQARSKMDSIMGGVRSDMLKTSLSRDEINGLLRSVKFDIKDRAGAGQTRGQMREFIRMFNGGGFTTVPGEGKDGVGRSLNNVTIKGSERAHAEVSNGKVTLKPGSGVGAKGTNFHELAHIIEGQRPWLRSMLENWRDSRAFSRDEIAQFIRDPKGRPMTAAGYTVGSNGEQIPIIRLNRFNPLYGKEEVAVADSFVDPYMGKVYRHGRGTEVLSMAVQHFADSSKMTDLYVSHPELFNLVVGLSAS